MGSYLFPLLAPAALLLAAGAAFRRPGRRPGAIPILAEAAAMFAVLVTLAALVVWVRQGPVTSLLIGLKGIGLAVRIDGLSAIMMVLVAFVGWLVVRYARTYLDGDSAQGRFTGWLCAALAMVLMLVQAGNLLLLATAWIGVGICLHRLLLFYPERPGARRAARKKSASARLGDTALLLALGMLVFAYGTGDIAAIGAAARAGEGHPAVFITALMLAFAAIVKSAQFPLHGWLTEVMETPTPVSALLHAGIVNAGGFLLIRFADVMLLAPGVLAVLVMVGGFTAIFASLVMLTQSAVKTSLAWSTIAQMGFMIMQCGLALFPLALLHIVAHSLYKAHAFLASGSTVEAVAATRRPGPIAIPGARSVVLAFVAALAIYATTGFAFGFSDKSPQAIAIGAILVFGVAYLLAQGLADDAPRLLTRRTALYSVAASVAYFLLHGASAWLMTDTLPATPPPGRLEWALIVLVVVSFGAVAVAQALFPLWAYHPAAVGLRVHIANGLYINALTDRILRGWTTRHSA
ncbi:MAG: proton-conducting transporter membrane subunit [Xanthomonadales bacterium]|nr:proton-conducting transporter membrane subunit [Xanthomonadales bacterium]